MNKYRKWNLKFCYFYNWLNLLINIRSSFLKIFLSSLAESATKWDSCNTSDNEDDSSDEGNCCYTHVGSIFISKCLYATLLRHSIWNWLWNVEETFFTKTSTLVGLFDLFEELLSFTCEHFLGLLIFSRSISSWFFR